jgi:hypothetical protein
MVALIRGFSMALGCAAIALLGCSESGGSSDGGTGTDGGANHDAGSGSCQPVVIDGVVAFSRVLTKGNTYITTASFPAQPMMGVVDFLSCNPGCNFFPHSDAGVDAGQSINVGTVTAEDTTTAMSQTLVVQNLGNGPLYESLGLSWSAGDSLQASGTGDGGFPSFTVTVQAPAVGAGLTPLQLLDGGLVSASTAAGLSVTWTPSSPLATFVAVTIDTPIGGINCYVPDSDGTLNIPSSVLSNIPTGTYSLPEGIVFGRWVAQVEPSGGKNIGVQSTAYLGASFQLGP